MMSLLSASLSSATADDLWEKATKTHYNHQHYTTRTKTCSNCLVYKSPCLDDKVTRVQMTKSLLCLCLCSTGSLLLAVTGRDPGLTLDKSLDQHQSSHSHLSVEARRHQLFIVHLMNLQVCHSLRNFPKEAPGAAHGATSSGRSFSRPWLSLVSGMFRPIRGQCVGHVITLGCSGQ